MYFRVTIDFANAPQSHAFFQQCDLRSIERDILELWNTTKVPTDAPKFELPWYSPYFSWKISPDWVHYADPRVHMQLVKRVSPMLDGKLGMGKPIVIEVIENIHLDFSMKIEDILAEKIREQQANAELLPDAPEEIFLVV